MLKQPVAKELRSFKSLSKFDPRSKRSMTTRRSSGVGRRHSHRRHTEDHTPATPPGAMGPVIPEEPSTSKMLSESQLMLPSTSAMPPWSDVTTKPTIEHQRKSQVEWDDEADFIEEEDESIPYPGYVEPSLLCLRQAKPPRSWALTMVMNPWFDRLTMIVIMINCVTLGMFRPCEDGADCHTYRCQLLSLIDHMIFGYFAMEMLIKIIALGFHGENAYLSDTWNRLDFFIVIAGVAEYLLQEYLGNINLTAIRTIRVLRPLRAVNRIPSMRILVNLLLDTLPMLGNVLLLCFFVFFIFGIVGVQLWAGLLRNRCVINLPTTNFSINFTEMAFADVALTRYYIPEDTNLDYICAPPDSAGLHTCQNLPPYRQNGIKCNLTLEEYDKVSNESCINWNIYYNECRVMHKNPFQGSVSFDNIGFAWTAIFLVISLEGWTDIMYYVQDAHSFWNWIYFVLLIVIGAFFMINLCLVVIATQFAETKRRETERMLQERKRMQSSASFSSSEQGGLDSAKGDSGGDSVYAAIVRMIGHWSRRLKRYLLERWSRFRESRKDKSSKKSAKIESRKRKGSTTFKETSSPVLSRNSISNEVSLHDHAFQGHEGQRLNGSVKKHKQKSNLKEITTDESSTESEHGDESDDVRDLDAQTRLKKHESRSVNKYSKNSASKAVTIQEAKMFSWRWFRLRVKRFVICDHFTRGILVAILVNTLSMGVEYHQQPELLTTILEYSNLFFTALFAFEMCLKIVADGLLGYLSDGFNVFDGGIVALSVLELFQEGKGGLSVLRTFRLLRILKLVRFMPALRYQLVVMLRTMDNVTVFFGLLMLFIFIFSILGMNLFGCRFCKTDEDFMGFPIKRYNCDCDRTNFDHIGHAVLTVFQILTQEDWNMVLFNGMSQTTPWAALYFVALMTFGNYVLFNLLVAILVEGFQESKEEEKRQLEEEARKRAEEEERERKGELEQLIAKTAASPTFLRAQESKESSPTFLRAQESKECTCNKPADERRLLAIQPRTRYDTNSSEGQESSENVVLPENISPRSFNNHVEVKVIPKQVLSSNQSLPTSRLRNDSYSDERRPHTFGRRFVHRHQSLMNPARGMSGEMHPALLRQRQRQNSWDVRAGLHTLFDPNCPLHGTRALIEAYAREKYIKASQELEQALAEEEKREEERNNTRWRRFLSKTCFYSRADYSLFLFGPKNRLRILCLRLTQKKWFDYIILTFIGINCITLAMERPSVPPDSIERTFLTITGYIFTCIFTIEMTMKMLANGCVFGPGSYFKDGWNILDGVLVIISLINIIMELFVSGDSPKIFGVIRVLRLLRALRPLRVINRAPGVKLVVMTLISSLKPIGNIVLICCTFFIIFGILGVQLFKGMMFHCIGPELANITTKADCLQDSRNRWVNHRYNFDNLGQALMSLFVLSSKDGWVSIMYQGIDSVGVDMQPIENYNEWRMIYFISFLLLVGFFVLNMFVGVVVENFHKCKDALEAEMKEKARQKRLERKLKNFDYEEKIAIKRKKSEEDKLFWEAYGPRRLSIYNIVASKYFDLAIAAVIGINVISMAMEFYMMPDGLRYVLKALNYFFTAVFTLEAAMKLYALGFRRCFRERWNQLDMFIVILSIAGIIFEEFEALELPINPTIIRVMRVLRIARVLKLLKMAKGIRSLLDTVGEALPQVGNLGSLFFLLFFIFAALGVELFGKLECSDDHPCDGLGEHAHFKNFGMAFLTLFRIATGDNWNGIMKDALRDDCDPTDHCQTNCCVDPILAPCYFVIFVLISQFVLVNVVVAVLMKHLEESNKRNEVTDASTTVGTDIEDKIDTDAEDLDDIGLGELV
uniref:Voltage-dependent T-type calcium channel subunit alpha n=1 Tax=Acrobeloides nanus TaxID=290746 RepID=A0A914C966_9BILA